MRKKILIFPCGSEVALEIFRSVRYSRHFELIGGSSVSDGGKFYFHKYIENIPFYNAENFIEHLKNIIKNHHIDAIFPAMDCVALKLAENEDELGCKIIGSSLKATQIASSKAQTYSFLKKEVSVPALYDNLDVANYPIFIKPDIGYGSRGTCVAKTKEEAIWFIKKNKNYGNFLFCELLVGEEYTIDCFSNHKGELLFNKARVRSRVSGGISVGAYFVKYKEDIFNNYAKKINTLLNPRGAWFFQMKKSKEGELKLLEVAVRAAGSSSLSRSIGINLPLMTLFDAFGYEVGVLQNSYPIELNRALDVKFSIGIEYDTVYVDLDDCLIIDNRVNTTLISFLYQALNQNKKIILLTKHAKDIENTLNKFRMKGLFDLVVQLKKDENKSDYITSKEAIFIDDSFQERKDVSQKCEIAVFSPDMVEALLL